MKFKIGFHADSSSTPADTRKNEPVNQITEIRKSLVEVYFPVRNRAYSYYNDRFDLHTGDNVYVEGKLEGLLGVVTNVNYNFKIKLSDYKRVISIVDTSVKGELFFADEALLTFDRTVMPYEKVLSWFKAVTPDEEEIVSGNDNTSFPLEEIPCWPIEPEVMKRGFEYLKDDRVKYICVDNGQGKAIVVGSNVYEIEFTLNEGEISGLTCNCYCNGLCKHDAATLMFLKSMMDIIAEEYIEKFEESDYFAAVNKTAFYSFVVVDRKRGSFTLN